MFPGLGKMNPKQMQGMLKQFGIKSEEIESKKVIIELKNGKDIEIEEPNVTVMLVQGQKIYSVMGGTEKEKKEEVPEEDIEMVMQQTGSTREKAIIALKKSDGDIARAIFLLKKK